MSTQLPWYKVQYVLLRREFAEHRMLFVYLPLVLAGLGFAAFALWLVQAGGPPEAFMELVERGAPPEWPPEIAQDFARRMQEQLEGYHAFNVRGWYWSIEAVMLWALWGSMAFYYVNTLYQTRKDRSILFWNSMPVSDAHTVLSKVLAGLVGCHLVYLLCFAALDLGIFLAVQLKASLSDAQGFANCSGAQGVGYRDTQGFVYLASTAVPCARSLESVAMAPTSLFWALPVYGWLLLASAWSRQAPFAWAAGPLVVITLGELALTEKSRVVNKIAEHLFPFRFEGFAWNTSGFPAPELALGALLGTIFVYAAVRFNRAEES
jgi:hypothetical protein